MIKNEFLTVNKTSEPYNALIMTNYFLSQIINDEYYFKWSVIALHNCLQGFMVLAIRGTSDLQVLKPNKKNLGKTPFEILSNVDNQLDYFMNLFKKIQDDRFMRQYTNSISFVSTEAINHSVSYLNEIRNNFIHFLLSVYIIEKKGLLHCFQDCINIIYFLLNDSGNIKNRFYKAELKHMNKIIENMKDTIHELQLNF